MKTSTAIFLALTALPLFGQVLKVEPQPSPAGAASLQANWSVMPDGSALLSWVEKSAAADSLRYAIRRGAAWSDVRTVVARRHFFHHPAELPEVVALPGGSFMAHWIEMPKEGAEAEYLYVAASADGVRWSAPMIGHKDRSLVQHGLGSMVSSGPAEASMIWLQALKGEDGPVTLMRTVLSSEGGNPKIVKEETLDSDVCACCPTSVIRTTKGLLIAYRDHTAGEIRDIATIRFENNAWTASKIISPDRWQINACPINAAAAASKGANVAVAWYTAAGNKPRAQLALSSDNGANFGPAVLISTGQAYGYTSTASDDAGGAYVSWLERGTNNARLLVRHVNAKGVAGPVAQVAQGERESLGYPRLVRSGTETSIVWGNADGGSKVQTARISP